jgi:hypothetical protein
LHHFQTFAARNRAVTDGGSRAVWISGGGKVEAIPLNKDVFGGATL